MALKAVEASTVPAIATVARRLQEVSLGVTVLETAYDFDRMQYCLRLVGPTGRTADVELSVVLLRDIEDNTQAEDSKYSIELTTVLDAKLIEKIEVRGLCGYTENKLQFLLLSFIGSEPRGRHSVNKYNTIGRGLEGDFERWLRVTLLPKEKDSLIWVWDDLVRFRLIASTGTDLVAPDEWVKLTDRGVARLEGKDSTKYPELEMFLPKNTVYSAYRTLQQIFSEAISDVIIIDPYVDEQVLDHILRINSAICVQLLTETVKGDFKVGYVKLVQQRGNLEARRAVHFHDRYIILDRVACYQLGSSINHLGSKASSIERKSEAIRNSVLGEFDQLWGKANLI